MANAAADSRQILVAILAQRYYVWHHAAMVDQPDHRPGESSPQAPRFALGQVVMTPGVADNTTDEERMAALHRHVFGDWGEVCREDAAQNEWAIENGARIISAYQSSTRVKFWIITEADRSATTLLLPEEY